MPLEHNTRPILYTVGERDTTFGPELARTVAAATGGPVELYIHPNGMHQLMLSHTGDYSNVVLEWCLRQGANQVDRKEQLA